MDHSFKILFFLILASQASSQDYVAGDSYFGANDFIEYVHGNLPIILSAPHGGYGRPDDIPDRDCTGCVYERDSYTLELTEEIAESIHLRTGCYPHLIINKLHRIKLDANREIVEAADGDPLGEQAWRDYRDFIEFSRSDVSEAHGSGLFLDIHGHAHTIQRLELGYLLSSDELQLAEALNQESYIAETSIRNLVLNNKMNLELSDLLIGEYSFGTIIEERNYHAVPSNNDPFPIDGDPYFSGGYNTAQYGSKNGGSIDAIQIECNADVRFNDILRKEFADSLALTILDFLDLHYPDSSLCELSSMVETKAEDFHLYPMPVYDLLSFNSDKEIERLSLYNHAGIKVLSQVKPNDQITIDLSFLYPGMYFLVAQTSNGEIKRFPVIKI